MPEFLGPFVESTKMFQSLFSSSTSNDSSDDIPLSSTGVNEANVILRNNTKIEGREITNENSYTNHSDTKPPNVKELQEESNPDATEEEEASGKIPKESLDVCNELNGESDHSLSECEIAEVVQSGTTSLSSKGSYKCRIEKSNDTFSHAISSSSARGLESLKGVAAENWKMGARQSHNFARDEKSFKSTVTTTRTVPKKTATADILPLSSDSTSATSSNNAWSSNSNKRANNLTQSNGRLDVVVTPESPPFSASKMVASATTPGKRKREPLCTEDDCVSADDRPIVLSNEYSLPDAATSASAAVGGNLYTCSTDHPPEKTPTTQKTISPGNVIEPLEPIQDAIAGLFMMTQTTPKITSMPKKVAQPFEAAPHDAAAGLIMMTQCSQKPTAEPPASATKVGNPHVSTPNLLPPSFVLLNPSMGPTSFPAHYTTANASTKQKLAIQAITNAAVGDSYHTIGQAIIAKGSVTNEGTAPFHIVQQPFLCDTLNGNYYRKKGKFTTQEEEIWAKRFQQAVEFKRKHGHCRIPYQYPPNTDLSRWAKRQKYQYKLYIGEADAFEKKSSMTKERIVALENLGFCWDAQQESWDEQYEALVNYICTHGHAKVAKREKSLGRWVCSQRTRISQGKMTLDRFMKLEAVGFIWASQTPSQTFLTKVEEMRTKAKDELEKDPKARKKFAIWQAAATGKTDSRTVSGASFDHVQNMVWGNVLSPNAASNFHQQSLGQLLGAINKPPPKAPDPSALHDKAAAVTAKIGGTIDDNGLPVDVAEAMEIAADRMEATVQENNVSSNNVLQAKVAALRAAAKEIQAITNSSSCASEVKTDDQK